MDDARPEVLFVCVHNAGRSQMAAAFLAHHAGDRVVVRSAGSAPAEALNPAVVEAMAEVGIDLVSSGARPKKLEDAAVQASDVVITMGCGDACPFYPGKRYEDWKLDDPAGHGVEAVRPIRDEIERRVDALLDDLLSDHAHSEAPAEEQRNLVHEPALSGHPLKERTMEATALENLPLDQQHLVRTVAARLAPAFAGTFGIETVERFVADSIDQLLPSARITTFLPVLSERFARQRLRALARLESSVEPATPGVLFLCVHNAGRSQMAAGWLRHLAGDRVEVWSGGSEPASEVNPAAIAAMAEVGIDITEDFPKPWTDEIVRAADVVVTMGCGDACPLHPGKRYEDWELDDPAGQDLESVRPIRDDIRSRVEALLASLGVASV